MEETIGKLRRKEGTWIDWGAWCQELQKSGLTAQAIFEQTGFEPIHQNQLIVAYQVYQGIVESLSPGVLDYLTARGSEILYELRILPQPDRVASLGLVIQMGLNKDDTRLLAKAVKEFSTINPPPQFTNHPGDAVAYQAWKACQNVTDLTQRTQLISRGLRYAHSEGARQQIEQLLVASPTPPASPRLPIYRLDAEEQLPRIFPLGGKLPLTIPTWSSIPLIEAVPPFAMVSYEGTQAWISLPGWKVVQDVEDGIVVLADTDSLLAYSGQQIPSSFPDRPEEILLLIDRANRQWEQGAFFVVAEGEQIYLKTFATKPEVKLWGRLMLVLRQPRILEDTIGADPWILEE